MDSTKSMGEHSKLTRENWSLTLEKLSFFQGKRASLTRSGDNAQHLASAELHGSGRPGAHDVTHDDGNQNPTSTMMSRNTNDKEDEDDNYLLTGATAVSSHQC